MWRVTDPSVAPADHNWRTRPVSGIVHIWWALFIIQSVLGLGGFDTEADSLDDLETLSSLDHVDGIGALVAAAAAILAIIVVRRLTDRFSTRDRALGGQH